MNPVNGGVVVGEMSPGNMAHYFCDTGFELIGSDTVTCGYDGQWNPHPPVCTSSKIYIILCVFICMLKKRER